MLAASRVLPLAFVSFSAILTLRAQTAEELPPIFAPRAVQESPVASAANPPSLPLSPHARSLLNLAAHSALTEAKSRETSEPPRFRPDYSALESGDTVVMSRYVVRSAPLRSIPVRVSDSPLVNYLKTGTLFHKVWGNGKLEFKIDLRILPMTQTRRNGGWEFAMPQIGIGLSW